MWNQLLEHEKKMIVIRLLKFAGRVWHFLSIAYFLAKKRPSDNLSVIAQIAICA